MSHVIDALIHQGIALRENGKEQRPFPLRLAARDGEAWDEFIRRYGDLVYSTVHYTLSRSGFSVANDQVSDIVQDLFERLLADEGKALRSYEGRSGCSFGGWLKTVIVHHVYDFIRAQKSTVSAEDIPESGLHERLEQSGSRTLPSASENAAHAELMDHLKSATEVLNERERLVFRFYYADEKPRDQIARILSLEPNHVDQILFRIRKKLQEALVKGGVL